MQFSHQPLTLDHVLGRARREAQYEDFGTTQFMPQLRKMVEALNSILPQLHDKGRRGIEDRIVRLLVNRLRMRRDILAHPEILREEILPPAAIIGLPRTGSTKLQRLLASGRGLHELPMWQAFNPAPIPGPLINGRDPRLQAATEFVQWMAADAADAHKGHTMVVEGAEEEHHLLEQSFATPSPISFVPIYEFCHYIELLDKTEMYAHMRVCLQYLQWQFHREEHKSWLLKYPANLGNETYIDRNFPGTQYIVTHRDPWPVMASLAKLNAEIHRLHCHSPDIQRFSQWGLREFGLEMDRHLAWREANPQVRILDVSFKDIVKDGFGTARRIYDFLGLPWNPEVEAAVRAWIEEDARTHDRLLWSIEDLAYTEAECRERFRDYIERYSAYF